MTYTAYELLAKLRLFTLLGVDEEGNLEWAGTTKAFKLLPLEEESILRDYELAKI